MKTTDEKKAFLEAVKNLRDQRVDNRQADYFANKAGPDKSQNLAKGSLDNEVNRVKASPKVDDLTPERTVIGKTDRINTAPVPEKLNTGKEFRSKIDDLQMKNRLKATFKDAAKRGDASMMNKLKKIASKMKTGAKAIPGVGALAAIAGLAGAEDASAAIPILDSADSVGMSPQDENQMIAETQAKINYGNSPAAQDRLLALAKLAKSRKE